MRHHTSLPLIAAVCAFALQQLPAQNRFPLDVYNFLRIEYDDNVFTANSDVPGGKQESFVIIEQIEFLLDSLRGNTYFGLRYSPSFFYYENRPDDSTDINHQLDFILNQDFTPRTGMELQHTLRYAEEPELLSEDTTFRNKNDYLYNSLNAMVRTQVVPDKSTLRATGRFVDMSYDDSAVADDSDYQEMVGGLGWVQLVAPETRLTTQVRYSEVDYDSDFRDGSTLQLGFELHRVLNPKLNGDLRFGYEFHAADDPVAGDVDAPYVEASLSYQPERATRFSLGASYAQDKSPVNTFSVQERAAVFGTLSQALTAGVTLNLSGLYSMGNFDRDSATSLFDPSRDDDGDENYFRFITSLVYQVNVRNSLEASYQYNELESDVRPESDYDRNRISIGWKYSL